MQFFVLPSPSLQWSYGLVFVFAVSIGARRVNPSLSAISADRAAVVQVGEEDGGRDFGGIVEQSIRPECLAPLPGHLTTPMGSFQTNWTEYVPSRSERPLIALSRPLVSLKIRWHRNYSQTL